MPINIKNEYIYHFSLCTIILCVHMHNKCVFLLYVVAPKPSGSEAYCLTSHQGVHSEGLH